MTTFQASGGRRGGSRRSLLVGGAAGLVTACASARDVSAAPESLKVLAARKGVLFGSSVGVGPAGGLTGSGVDPEVLGILKADCAVLVAENEMKAYVIAPGPSGLDFEPAERIARFAAANGQKLRGHTLLWNRDEYLPSWLKAQYAGASAGKVADYLQAYIGQVCDHFGDRVFSWDVVNETVDPATGQIRQTPFTAALGFDALKLAFQAAREHAPKAQRVYNDYMSWEPGAEQHRTGVLRLLEQFRKADVPVDALGLQSHLGTDGDLNRPQERAWRTFVDEVVGLGYQLLITEFDVNDRNFVGAIAQRDAAVAASARAYLDLMLSYPQLSQVLCWGMVDRYSWLQSFSKRSDGAAQRPSPYDDAYRPKPLRAAIAAAFEAAPKR